MLKRPDAFRVVLFLVLILGTAFGSFGCQRGYLSIGPTVVGEDEAVLSGEEIELSGEGEAVEDSPEEFNVRDVGAELEQIKKDLAEAKEMAEEAQRKVKEAEIAELKMRQELMEVRMKLLELTGGSPKRLTTHEVVKGESLWKIAGYQHIYNNPYKWLEIYHANKEKIADPDIIYPGQVFVIPRY